MVAKVVVHRVVFWVAYLRSYQGRKVGDRVAIRTPTTEAHQKAVAFEIHDVAGYLQETLGQKLVAFMAGVSDPKRVGQWAQGKQAPRDEAERRLRAAFQIYHLLLSEDSAHVVRAWFIGMNPQLEDDSPAEAIRSGKLKEALAAARAFISGG
jgi:hypothetical protein